MANRYLFRGTEDDGTGSGWVKYFCGITDGKYIVCDTKAEAEAVEVNGLTDIDKIICELKCKYPSFVELGVEVADYNNDGYDIIVKRAEVDFSDAVKEITRIVTEPITRKSKFLGELTELYNKIKKSTEILELL